MRKLLSFLGIQFQFIHERTLQFSASAFELLDISSFQILDDDILYLHARKWSGAFAAQVDAIASDDAISPWRHFDHISRTDLEKEDIFSKFLS